MLTKHLALAVLLTTGASTALIARQSTVPAPQAIADAVRLDVSVLDAQGQPVRDLSVSDFEVSVGGAPVPVDGVAVVNLTMATTAVPAVSSARGLLAPSQVARDVLRNDDRVSRYVVVVLDDIARPGDGTGADGWMSTAGLDLARALVGRLGPDDRGAIFFSFMGRQQGLTADRDRLLAAIDGFTTRQVQPVDCQATGSVEACVVDTLQRVADVLPVAPHQRKSVVVISGHAGLPALTLPADGGVATTSAQRVFQALQATNAAVYSVTPAGVVPSTTVEGAAPGFADATGGRALVDSTLRAPIDAVWNESGGYYLLSFRPQSLRDGTFRRVTVRVNRPGAAVRTWSGYFAPGGPVPPPPGATTPLEIAIVAPQQALGLPMGATVAAFAIPGRREAVVSISAAVTSAAAPGATAWQAEIASTAFDPQWRPRASHRQTIEVTTSAAAGPQTVDVLSAIELLPGRYEIRVGAESGGRAGSVFVDVDVPEFQIAPLSASGAVVTTAPQPYAAIELLANTLPVTPTTRRMFLRHESAEVLLRFYQGGRNRLRNLPVSLRIADASGEGIIQGTETIPPSQFDESSRSTEWRFALPLGRLVPGEYLLTVEAELDDRRVARHVRFAVMP
jgi:VWFA-related protein